MFLRILLQLPSPDNWLCSGHLHFYCVFGLPYCCVCLPQLPAVFTSLDIVPCVPLRP